MRDGEAFTCHAIEIGTLELITWREGYRMNNDIDMVPEIVQVFKNGIDVLVA